MVCYNKFKVEQLVMFIFLLWSSTSIIHVKGISDSLKPGDNLNLNGTSRIYSKQGKYYLKFSRTDVNGGTYLVIYVDHATRYNIVWLFDRNQPIDPNSSALLSLSTSGVLKIESNEKTIILYSPPQPINNTLATLLDTGNFVLQQINLNPNGTKTSTILWQSFDHPTDTLFPTMKLGFNRKTGQIWSLTSWLTSLLPNSGPFSLEWEEHELVIKQRSRVYWKSGKLRNDGLFDNIPKDVQSAYEYTIVSNSEEDSFALKIKPTSKTKNKEVQGWILLANGRLISSEGDIAKANACYGYNRDNGCQIWEAIQSCREPGDAFQNEMGNPGFDNRTFIRNASYVYSDCKDICWNNCNCTGFKAFYFNDTGCIFFLSNSANDGDDADDNDKFQFHNLVKVKPVNPHGKKRRKWIGAIIAFALLITCTPILCLALKKLKDGPKEKKNKQREAEMQALAASNQSSIIKDIEEDLKGHDIKVFNYASILAATMGFSSENKLGEGGYGPVYKGILPTGQEVAVKRLSKTSGQGVVEFKNELTLICELQHTNLVELLGCCICEEERILLYEYMSNKSLDFYLFDSTRRKLLDWNKRFNIIEGISQGLLYLHKYSRLKIIHRDLKASNILLDENMNPKISDFGMARMFTQQESMVNTNRIVGTYGYMSPEYVMEGVFSTKSDVYSFGVLLLEIVSGRRNNSFSCEDMPLTLIGYAWELWKEGDCLQLMDQVINDTFNSDEVQRCIHVGLLCVEHYASDRPTMSNIISMLTNKNAFVPLPKRPAFYVGREIPKETTTSKSCETYSFKKEIATSSEEE